VRILIREMKTAQTQRRRGDHRTRVGRERSARTETRILEAALGVFADMGPDAPKIDDFVQAAGISRGTFYNHFESVEELLEATSEWTTREVVESIENAIQDLDGPVLRLGTGLRLFFAKAQADPVWCRFVARVWKLGGIELPARDVSDGIARGVFRAPSAQAARDLLFGGIREALTHIGTGEATREYGDEMTELFLQALGTDARRIAAVMKYELPRLEEKETVS
jgi:AcrR family transcriptional regulator